MTIQVLWNNGEVTTGVTATNLMTQLLGGWNPKTIPELRKTLAQRAMIPEPTNDESDIDFLYRLDAASVLCVQITDNNHDSR